jgi:hypothetical protein
LGSRPESSSSSVPFLTVSAGTMVRDKPPDTLALRRRLRDRLPCTYPTASCDDHGIDHGQKHTPGHQAQLLPLNPHPQ